MALERFEEVEREFERSPMGFVVAATLMLGAAIWIAHWSERAYRRWWKANHPFAGGYARIESAGANYRAKREGLGEVFGFFWEIFSEVSSAIEQAPGRRA